MILKNKITRKRYAEPSADSKGVYVAGSSTDISIRGSFQQLNEKELEQLTEGQRKKNPKKIYCRSTLLIDDVLIYDSTSYRVIRSEQRTQAGYLMHYKALCIEEADSG